MVWWSADFCAPDWFHMIIALLFHLKIVRSYLSTYLYLVLKFVWVTMLFQFWSSVSTPHLNFIIRVDGLGQYLLIPVHYCVSFFALYSISNLLLSCFIVFWTWAQQSRCPLFPAWSNKYINSIFSFCSSLKFRYYLIPCIYFSAWNAEKRGQGWRRTARGSAGAVGRGARFQEQKRKDRVCRLACLPQRAKSCASTTFKQTPFCRHHAFGWR